MNADIVVGIVYREHQVLIVKRKVPEGSLSWQFPGGYILEGETENEAVVRKVKVESGCDVNAVSCLGVRQHPDTKVIISYWACEYTDNTSIIQDNDISKAKWINITEISEYLYSVFEPVIAYLNEKDK